jgi:peptidoglycan/LPS O-acetylase OafA/YrhL
MKGNYVGYLKELQGLRGLLALWVLIGHLSTTFALPYPVFKTKFYNSYAVEVFIILSGFTIAALLNKRREAYHIYLARRFLRIFPVYLLFLFLSVLTAPFALSVWQAAPDGVMKASRVVIGQDSLAYLPWHLVAHVFAFHGLIPPKLLPSTDFAFLGQAWSISLEWQFYLIAPMLVPLFASIKTGNQLVGLTAGAIALVAFSIVMPAGFIGRNIHKFVIGILSFELVNASLNGRISHLDRAGTASAIVAILLLLLVILKEDAVLPFAIWAAVLGIILEKDDGIGWVNAGRRILNSRITQWIGKISYSIYLSHMLVIVFLLAVVETLQITNPFESAALLLVAAVAITILVSWCAYSLIEQPFHNLGQGLQSRSEKKLNLWGRL